MGERVLQKKTVMMKKILPLILLMPCVLHGQVVFKNNVVYEITVSKICYKSESFDKKNPYLIIKQTTDEHLICQWDFRTNVFYDGSRKRSWAINKTDSLQICDLLKELGISKKTPSASELGIERKKIDRIKHKCFKNNYSDVDEITFFDKNAAHTDFDSVMSCRFRDFDSNSLVINTALYSYSDVFCITIVAKGCQYSFIIRNHPVPLTPIHCYEKHIDLNNPSIPTVHKMYQMVNYSIQKKLSDICQRDCKGLFKSIQKELYLLYESSLERVFDGDSNCDQLIWR